MSVKQLNWLWLPCLMVATGCTSSQPGGTAGKSGAGGEAAPSFTLAWSEYPSWSVFGVADEQGLIDGKQGAMGSIEEKWNVDIVLKLAD